jgi:mRNA interferase RelE/StbE
VYSLEFDPRALDDWHKLQKETRERFKKMLAKRIENPRVPSCLVSGPHKDVYRLKLSSAGMRLIYQVEEVQKVIFIIHVGKREDSAAYTEYIKRLKSSRR